MRRLSLILVNLCLLGQVAAFAAPDRESVQFDARRIDFVVGESKAFLVLPTKPADDGSKPWIWYAPTFIGGHPDDSHTWMARQWLDAGFAIGGVEVGESYGNPDGVARYTAYYEYVRKTYGLDEKPCLLAQSRGGLMLFNWAAENAEKVQCIAGIYPVCNLESYPGIEKAAPAYKLTPQQLQEQLKSYNPVERVRSIAQANIPLLYIHGDVDQVVPVEKNSALLVERINAAGGNARMILVQGKGHQVCHEFFQSQELTSFVLSKGKLK
ncbi:MAG: hypothetical protein AMXMBFR84_24290 [Candidatus Hydrogenedentota bacterium]